MKQFTFLTIIVISISFSFIFSQTNFEVTVIDSFQWTDYMGYGVGNADAAQYDGEIYLSYYYYPNGSNKYYVICAKKNNNTFTFDTVATFISDGISHALATSLQIDSNGNPWIYYLFDGNIFASRKNNNVWVTDQIVSSERSNTSGITTIDGGGDRIGLFQTYKIPNTIDPSKPTYAVMFIHWDNNSWESDILYESDNYWRSGSISAVNAENDVYVSFVTVSGSPDSVVVHVMKDDNNIWIEDFSDVIITQLGGAYISEKGLLGKSQNGNVFLWREYCQNDLGEDLGARLFKKDTNGWQRIQLDSPPNGFMALPQGSNLSVTNNETAVVISEGNGFDPKISWAKDDGTSGLNEELPHWWWNPFSIWLQDIVAVDDNIYIYYTNGAAGSYNSPVTFNEAKININSLVTDVKSKGTNIPDDFRLEQNYPNPFNPTTTIKYAIPTNVETLHTTSVHLKVYDILGNEISTLVYDNKQPGVYEVQFDAGKLTSGVYYYQLTVGSFVQTQKMILIK